MRRNAAVVGGEAVFGVLLKLLLPLGKVLRRAFGRKIFPPEFFQLKLFQNLRIFSLKAAFRDWKTVFLRTQIFAFSLSNRF